MSKTNTKIGKSNPECFVTTFAKRKISPGPAKHSPTIAQLNKLSKSSIPSRKRV